MWPNPQFPAGLVTFTEEILNGKLHFLRSDLNWKYVRRLYYVHDSCTAKPGCVFAGEVKIQKQFYSLFRNAFY